MDQLKLELMDHLNPELMDHYQPNLIHHLQPEPTDHLQLHFLSYQTLNHQNATLTSDNKRLQETVTSVQSQLQNKRVKLEDERDDYIRAMLENRAKEREEWQEQLVKERGMWDEEREMWALERELVEKERVRERETLEGEWETEREIWAEDRERERGMWAKVMEKQLFDVEVRMGEMGDEYERRVLEEVEVRFREMQTLSLMGSGNVNQVECGMNQAASGSALPNPLSLNPNSNSTENPSKKKKKRCGHKNKKFMQKMYNSELKS